MSALKSKKQRKSSQRFEISSKVNVGSYIDGKIKRRKQPLSSNRQQRFLSILNAILPVLCNIYDENLLPPISCWVPSYSLKEWYVYPCSYPTSIYSPLLPPHNFRKAQKISSSASSSLAPNLADYCLTLFLDDMNESQLCLSIPPLELYCAGHSPSLHRCH